MILGPLVLVASYSFEINAAKQNKGLQVKCLLKETMERTATSVQFQKRNLVTKLWL